MYYIGACEGQYVTPETELYMIADLATMWVYTDIYEHELPWWKCV
ncbi:MAG: efflux RND transporter periplasmic adaptor subunit [Methylococcales bacterium]